MIAYLIPIALLQTNSVTVTTVPMGPIKTVFARMSPLLPKPVFASPILAKEPLFVHVKNVSFSDLRSKIALAMNGTWEEKPEGWMLTRTKTQTAADIKAKQGVRTKRAKDLISRWQGIAKGLPKFDEAYAQELVRKEADEMRQMQAGTLSNTRVLSSLNQLPQNQPQYHLVARIVSKLSPKDFAMAADGATVTYTQKPNAKQQKLGFDPIPLFKEFSRQKKLWIDAKQQSLGKNQFFFDNNGSFDKPESMQIFVTVSSSEYADSIGIKVFSDKGSLLVDDLISSHSVMSQVASKEDEDETPKKPYVPKFSPRANVLFQSVLEYPNFDADAEKYLKQMADVENLDPLELMATDALRNCAEKKNQNCVISADDELIVMMEPEDLEKDFLSHHSGM